MYYRLTYITGPSKGLTIDFNQDVVTIGRSIENNMVVDEKHVSGYHARVFNQAGQVLIEDLGSTNGTFINGKRIISPTVLHNGDTLQFGTQVRVRFMLLSASYEDNTVIGATQEFPDYDPRNAPGFPMPVKKKKFPIWIIIVILVIIFVCGGVILIGGGGLLAINLFDNSESQTQVAAEVALVETEQAYLAGTQTAQTATMQAQGTADAQTAATNAAIANYWDVALNAMGTTPLYGPVSGSLIHADDGSVESYSAGVSYQNAVVTVDFYPPYIVEQSKWDVGIFFRDLGSNNEMRLEVMSDGSFYLINRDGENEEILFEETISGVNLDPNSSNSLVLILWDNRAIFFLNNQFIKEFDISARMQAGDIAVATNIETENFMIGAATNYENFTIYALPAQ